MNDIRELVGSDTGIGETLTRLVEETVIPPQLAAELDINTSDLEGELRDQPYRFAQYATQHARALALFEDAKASLDLFLSENDAPIRRRLAEAGVKGARGGVTDKIAEAALKAMPEYADALYAKHRAYEQVQLTEAIRRSFEERGRMLQMIAASRNAQLRGTP